MYLSKKIKILKSPQGAAEDKGFVENHHLDYCHSRDSIFFVFVVLLTFCLFRLKSTICSGETVDVHSVAWNREHGWIACGCGDGLLKILKLEGMTPPPKPYVLLDPSCFVVSFDFVPVGVLFVSDHN